MRKEINSNAGRIITVGTAAALAVLLILVLIGVSSERRRTAQAFDEASAAAKENIAVELKEYFGQYLTNQKGELRDLTNTVETLQDTGSMTIELTAEQQEKLIAGVLENLTPEKVMEVADANNKASADAITALEQSIYDRLVENFSSYYEKAELTESQKEALADAIIVIVEKNIYDELEKRFESQQKYMTQIEHSVTEKLDKVTNTVNNYQQTVKELESKLVVAEKNSANLEEVERLKAQLLELNNSYQSFVSSAQPAINIITNLSVEPTGDNDVLSAQAGYTLNQKISNLNVTLTSAYEDFTAELTQKVNENDLKQSQKLADAKADLENQIEDNSEKVRLLDAARQAAEKALQTKSEEDINALRDAMNKLGSDMSDDLKTAYDSLLAADVENKQEITYAIEALELNLNNDIQVANNNITNLKADLEAAKKALERQLALTETTLQVQMAANDEKQSQNLADTKSSLEGQMSANDEKQTQNLADTKSSLEGQMSANDEKQSQNLADTKTNLEGQIQQMGDDVNNNIKAKLPVYTWSNGGTHLSINIPPQ